MKLIQNIAIIGSGNVAWHLAQALSHAGFQIPFIFNRNIDKANEIVAQIPNSKAISDIHKIEPSLIDLVLICVSDDAIQEILNILDDKNLNLAYTSGSVELRNLETKNKIGSFYPLQTFTKYVKTEYSTIPFLIESRDKKLENELLEMAKKISQNTYLIDSEKRKTIHLAAVFINNFTNHLIHLSNEILEQSNVPKNILNPLLEETLKKVNDIGALNAQTGPARRNDLQIIENHLSQLKGNKKEIYQSITKSIIETYKHD